MDEWSKDQLNSMFAGGNARLAAAVCSPSLVGHSMRKGSDLPNEWFAARYTGIAAELYRKQLAARASGRPEPTHLSESEASAIVSAQQRVTAGSSPTVKPNWVPDGNSAVCEVCFVKFTLLNRRHHCRRCGKLVCSDCAPKNNSRPIPEFGLKEPVRHCRLCYKSPAVLFKGETKTGFQQSRIGKLESRP